MSAIRTLQPGAVVGYVGLACMGPVGGTPRWPDIRSATLSDRCPPDGHSLLMAWASRLAGRAGTACTGTAAVVLKQSWSRPRRRWSPSRSRPVTGALGQLG